jgi:hypothetical protein
VTTQELQGCLERFAHGLMSSADLEECLKGRRRFRFWDTNERSIENHGELPTVMISREDVDVQLRRFLARDLSARDLSDWVAALRLTGCFEVNEDEPGSSEVWDLLDELISPDAWGPLTIDSVIDLRRRLANR